MQPTARALERALADDLVWAGSELGAEIREVTPVSPVRGRDRPRAAFRLTLADGRQLKLRRMRSPERAAELARLTERLRHLGVPRVVARRAESLVVDWIEGSPLPAGDAAPDRVEQAARLLALIHATPDFDGQALPALRSTAAEFAGMAEELSVLVRERRLDPDAKERLLARVRPLATGHAAHGIIHGDFCAENLVVDPDGRLRVVDNEGLEAGPLALDLARVWARWPMPEAAWERFVAAYRGAGGARIENADLLVWKLRCLVRSAWYRVTYRLAGEEAALARLRSPLESL